LTLSLKTFIIFLGYIIYFYNPVSVPQEKSGQKRQKKCIGSEMSEKTMIFADFEAKKFPKIIKVLPITLDF
jgi:hypothetical protein